VPLPKEDTAFHEKIEYAQNLWDFASRTMGGAFKDRVSIFPRRVIIQAGPTINLSERLSSYKENKKAAIATALSDLRKAYLDCIVEANNLEKK
jgi:alpha-D-ribose 1-methylphosphonate 5-triphosphate synthase subunit PhnL